MHILKTGLLIFVLLFPAIYGCSKKEDGNTQAIKKSILLYDDALIKAYRELDYKPLYGLASEREIGKVRMIILKFVQEKTFMESELKDVRFIRIDRKEDTAEVEISERWRFRHLKGDTKEEVLPWRDEEYRLLYKMARNKGKWIVDSSKFVE